MLILTCPNINISRFCYSALIYAATKIFNDHLIGSHCYNISRDITNCLLGFKTFVCYFHGVFSIEKWVLSLIYSIIQTFVEHLFYIYTVRYAEIVYIFITEDMMFIGVKRFK